MNTRQRVGLALFLTALAMHPVEQVGLAAYLAYLTLVVGLFCFMLPDETRE